MFFKILKNIGFILFGSVLFCFIYFMRSVFLGIDLDIFKNDLKKNIIFYAISGAVIAIVFMIYYRK